MAGVRIHHPTETSCVFVIVNARRPYPVPLVCLACQTTHLFKTYHIVLDSFGNGIVAEGIVDRIKAMPGQPFRFENEVANPPPMTIGGERLTQPIVQHKGSSNG